MLDHIEVYPIVLDVIGELTNRGQHFTAFSVTQEVRKATGEQTEHMNLVRPAAHAIMMTLIATKKLEWAATLKELGFPTPVWVYHPVGEEPDLKRKAFPEMIPVESSAIAEVGFVLGEPVAGVPQVVGTMYITFMSGNTYTYKDVGVLHFVGLLNAPSKGKYYNRHIKPLAGNDE
jgi:hypothetical protein